MEWEEFSELVKNARKREDTLMATKGKEYTRDDTDRLANFIRGGERSGVTPMQAWSVLFGKHLDAVFYFVQTGKVESEDIFSRLDDLRVYLFLAEALIRTNQTRRKAPQPGRAPSTP